MPALAVKHHVVKNYLAICATFYPHFTEGRLGSDRLTAYEALAPTSAFNFSGHTEKFTSLGKVFFPFCICEMHKSPRKAVMSSHLCVWDFFIVILIFPLPSSLYSDKPGVHVWSIFWFLRNCKWNATSLVSCPEGSLCEPATNSAGKPSDFCVSLFK